MRTSKPPPLVHIQEKRGNNVMLANGALRHAGYPLSLLRLLCRASLTASMELRDTACTERRPGLTSINSATPARIVSASLSSTANTRTKNEVGRPVLRFCSAGLSRFLRPRALDREARYLDLFSTI